MAGVNDYSYQEIHDKKLSASVCVSAVVKVLEFDPSKMTVNVQPLSKHLENGKYESQPPILRVPVACTRAGGFIFRPWYKPGDTGIVVYLDHDIDSVVAGGKESKPLTERNHSTSDAVFVGAIISGTYSAPGLPYGSLALATEDGRAYVAITSDKVQIKNEGTTAEFKSDSIDINAKNVSINASGVVTIKGSTVNIDK